MTKQLVKSETMNKQVQVSLSGVGSEIVEKITVNMAMGHCFTDHPSLVFVPQYSCVVADGQGLHNLALPKITCYPIDNMVKETSMLCNR